MMIRVCGDYLRIIPELCQEDKKESVGLFKMMDDCFGVMESISTFQQLY